MGLDVGPRLFEEIGNRKERFGGHMVSSVNHKRLFVRRLEEELGLSVVLWQGLRLLEGMKELHAHNHRIAEGGE